MKRRHSYLWIVVVALAAGVLLTIVSDLKSLRGRRPAGVPRIDPTAAVIAEINKIAQVTTACFYEEKLVHESKYRIQERKQYRYEPGVSRLQNMMGLNYREDGVRLDSVETASLIFIARSKVKAGYDFSQLCLDDISFSGDTLVVKLPPVRILDVIVNPSDWELYHRRGSWDYEEVRDVQTRALEEIRGDAVSEGLLEKAGENGRERLEALFLSFGFPNVRFEQSLSLSVDKM